MHIIGYFSNPDLLYSPNCACMAQAASSKMVSSSVTMSPCEGEEEEGGRGGGGQMRGHGEKKGGREGGREGGSSGGWRDG